MKQNDIPYIYIYLCYLEQKSVYYYYNLKLEHEEILWYVISQYSFRASLDITTTQTTTIEYGQHGTQLWLKPMKNEHNENESQTFTISRDYVMGCES